MACGHAPAGVRLARLRRRARRGAVGARRRRGPHRARQRDLRDATWPALAGTLAAEGSFETLCGVLLAVVAVHLGVSTLHLPSVEVLAAALVVVPLGVLLASRCGRIRASRARSARGVAILAHPRRWVGQVLPFQIAARLLRLCAAACFLRAFGLPIGPTIVIAACAAQGSGAALPVPGAGRPPLRRRSSSRSRWRPGTRSTTPPWRRSRWRGRWC